MSWRRGLPSPAGDHAETIPNLFHGICFWERAFQGKKDHEDHKERGLTAMSNSRAKRIRVGIIGANPDRGWAAQAHIPALRSLSDDFEITALSTTRRESAAAAGKLF